MQQLIETNSFRYTGRLPRHIGFIPDGNRRWAKQRGLTAEAGYAAGIEPGVLLLKACKEIGIREISIYGFTQDNTKRPKDQTSAYRRACVEFANAALAEDVALLALGDTNSSLFPEELIPFTKREDPKGRMLVNLLVNYGWNWDLQTAIRSTADFSNKSGPITDVMASADVSRIDLIVRWGGMRRLSGFLPVQSVYADFFVHDAYWPDYDPMHLEDALRWYAHQDVTLGG